MILKINIMNYQINDYGLLKATFSYKTIYDFIKIAQKIGFEKININKNKYYKRFFIMTNILGITDYKIKLNLFDKLHIYRFKLKRGIRKYYYLDNCHDESQY